jgi:transcription antitermination factor NusG
VSGFIFPGSEPSLIHPPGGLNESSAGQLGVSEAAEQPEWYALHTRCRHEKRAAEELQEKGIRVFLPSYKEQRRWSDRRKIIEVPLFSCYVFVHLIAASPARLKALQVFGILKFVAFNGVPAAIPPAQIASVQTILERSKGFSPFRFVEVGQRVRIRGGALDGVEGVLVERKNDRRLVVSIDLIRQAMAVVIDGYDVEPV